MKTGSTRIISFICAVCMISALLCSCSSADNTETRQIAQPLIEQSLTMDKILYGEGLEVSPDGKEGKYSKVVSDEFSSLQDIRDRCAEIYTAELCAIIENSVLRGSTTEFGSSYAKYVELEGVLYKYDGAKIYIEYTRAFDFDSIKTKSATDKRIIFTIDTYAADEEGNYAQEPENIEMKMLFDDSLEAWRLDTPTF